MDEGQELNIKSGKKDFLVMKYEDNFLGCGKASEEKISNFIPKMRRLKNRKSLINIMTEKNYGGAAPFRKQGKK